MTYEDRPSKKEQTALNKKKELNTMKQVNKSKKALETYKIAKSGHKAEIARLRADRRKLKNDIKRHKLLIKQAHTVYKLEGVQ